MGSPGVGDPPWVTEPGTGLMLMREQGATDIRQPQQHGVTSYPTAIPQHDQRRNLVFPECRSFIDGPKMSQVFQVYFRQHVWQDQADMAQRLNGRRIAKLQARVGELEAAEVSEDQRPCKGICVTCSAGLFRLHL